MTDLERQCEEIRNNPWWSPENVQTLLAYIEELKARLSICADQEAIDLLNAKVYFAEKELAELRRPSDAKEIAQIQDRAEETKLHSGVTLLGGQQAVQDRLVLLHALAESQRDNARLQADLTTRSQQFMELNGDVARYANSHIVNMARADDAEYNLGFFRSAMAAEVARADAAEKRVRELSEALQWYANESHWIDIDDGSEQDAKNLFIPGALITTGELRHGWLVAAAALASPLPAKSISPPRTCGDGCQGCAHCEQQESGTDTAQPQAERK